MSDQHDLINEILPDEILAKIFELGTWDDEEDEVEDEDEDSSEDTDAEGHWSRHHFQCMDFPSVSIRMNCVLRAMTYCKSISWSLRFVGVGDKSPYPYHPYGAAL